MASESCAGWLTPGLSLSSQIALEAARRAVPRMHRHDLEARLDSTLVALATTQNMLNQAMRRVAELELREIVNQPPGDQHQAWAAEVLAAQANKLG